MPLASASRRPAGSPSSPMPRSACPRRACLRRQLGVSLPASSCRTDDSSRRPRRARLHCSHRAPCARQDAAGTIDRGASVSRSPPPTAATWGMGARASSPAGCPLPAPRGPSARRPPRTRTCCTARTRGAPRTPPPRGSLSPCRSPFSLCRRSPRTPCRRTRTFCTADLQAGPPPWRPPSP